MEVRPLTLGDELVSEHAPATVPEHVHAQVSLQRPPHGTVGRLQYRRLGGLAQVGDKRTPGGEEHGLRVREVSRGVRWGR